MGTRNRGRPSNLSKLHARQGDLFPEERFRAALATKYPMLAMSADSSDAARSEGRARTADAQRPLGKPIRDLPPLSAADSEK